MSKYIDADAYIKYCDRHWIALNVDAVNAQPAADVVEVLRCGECKFYTGTYCHHKMQYGLSVTESDYCSKGERKDG